MLMTISSGYRQIWQEPGCKSIGLEILRRKVKIEFDLDCRTNDVDEETLSILQGAGLQHLGTGLESMLSRQLNFYRKGTTWEQNRRAIDILERLGLAYHLYLVPIEPYVTVDELLQTMEFMEEVGLSHIFDGQILGWLMVLEGTTMIERLRKDKITWHPPGRDSHQYFPWGSTLSIQG